MHTAKIRRFLSIHKGLLAAAALLLSPWAFFRLKLYLTSLLRPELDVALTGDLQLFGILAGAAGFFALYKLARVKFSVLLAVLAVCYVPWLFLMRQVYAATAVYGVCIGGSTVLALLALYELLTYNPKEI